ncbi:glycosyltransferase family 4 protein [Tabrizicola soli]|uniref:Glycosyltransferase family 4 protein n=1 Tax=Tabrizicola soli TaxID=2185115 RepID=A0ABV7DXW8_9RHOB|nr:glycosyltransferase [Tabrizicola soli]
MPIRVLCVLDYYLPGFKGGGPLRTIANMRRLLAGRVELAVFTRDRDLGADQPYDGIELDRWIETPDDPVYYARPETFSAAGLQAAMEGQPASLLYLNSFFGFRSSIQIYHWARRQAPPLPILLAPRGEFSQGALAIKPSKKWFFLTLCKWFRLYRDVSWHASTAAEQADILRQFPSAAGRIHLAKDPVDLGAAVPAENRPAPSPAGQLRLCFLSRISPMKNLDGLLRALAQCPEEIALDIWGPVEDAAHWQACQRLMAALPAHVTVQHKGPVAPEAVSATFAAYDLFAFPTHGENFGHVIFEALRAGTPVLVSDRTPWQAGAEGALRVLSLTGVEGGAQDWAAGLSAFAAFSAADKGRLRQAARHYAEDFVQNSDIAAKNLAMFQAVAAGQVARLPAGSAPQSGADAP